MSGVSPAPNLGVLPPAAPSGNVFGVASGNALMGQLNGQPAAPALAPPSILAPAAAPGYNLGVLPSTQDPSRFWGVSSPSALSAEVNKPKVRTAAEFLQSGSPNPASSVGELTADIAASLTHMHALKTASEVGKALNDVQKGTAESGKNRTEAVACNTAKVAAELVVDAVATGLVVHGATTVLKGAAEFPPLAVVIPPMAQALPQAYANAKEMGKFAGEKAEEWCHKQFEEPAPKP